MILAGTIALWLAAIIAWLFVLVYAISAPWYRSEEGTHLISFTGFLAVVMTYVAVVGLYSSNEPQYPLARLLVWVGVAVFMGWRFSLLLRRQIARNTFPKEK